MRTGLILALAVAGTAGGGHAEGPARQDSAALEACIDDANGADLALKDCWVELANKEDARLNRNWTRLMETVGGNKTEIGASLLTGQRAWLAYRDSACQHFLVPGTTLERLMSQSCYTGLLTDRADELERLVQYYDDTVDSEG